jgi:hypothetical protein
MNEDRRRLECAAEHMRRIATEGEPIDTENEMWADLSFSRSGVFPEICFPKTSLFSSLFSIAFRRRLQAEMEPRPPERAKRRTMEVPRP